MKPQVGYKYLEDDLACGQVIEAKNDHLPKLSSAKQAAEIAIRAGHPQGYKRACCVFAFESRNVAEELRRETKHKSLYEVSIDKQDIFHRGDLQIYDEVVRVLLAGDKADGLVEEFWRGITRKMARIEIAALKVTIQRKL
jgi:hypothetical protein